MNNGKIGNMAELGIKVKIFIFINYLIFRNV